jgi:hypothetical protein
MSLATNPPLNKCSRNAPSEWPRAASELAVARQFVAVGLSVFPVKTNGSKEPAISGWRAYAARRPADWELRSWFNVAGRHGIAIAGGPASGNLVVFDFETFDGFSRWCRSLDDRERAALAGSPVVRAPRGGRHVYVRAVEPVRGCKLARTTAGETLIETRGCQHYVVAPGSPATVHPTGIPYAVARAGWLDGTTFPQMPVDVFNALAVRAVDLNEYIRPAKAVGDDRPAGSNAGDRPGDHFNNRVPWSDILESHGWRVFRGAAETVYWSRPGKSPQGVSASTGFCKGRSGNDLLYVFSTAAAPFDAEVAYSRFAAYAILNHEGDFRAAARALGYAGYGGQPIELSGGGKAVRP